MNYQKISEISGHALKTIYGEICRKAVSVKILFYNGIDKGDFIWICSGQMMKKSNDCVFIVNKQNPFF